MDLYLARDRGAIEQVMPVRFLWYTTLLAQFRSGSGVVVFGENLRRSSLSQLHPASFQIVTPLPEHANPIKLLRSFIDRLFTRLPWPPEVK
jgi:hypothetical protein